mmetsp:Transcript_25107/g.83747  ORF Transcript_25107/g.83747 Transcript_25107/m.83747 type:complete len:211 (+) Transcript_25107:2302-2934(+)
MHRGDRAHEVRGAPIRVLGARDLAAGEKHRHPLAEVFEDEQPRARLGLEAALVAADLVSAAKIPPDAGVRGRGLAHDPRGLDVLREVHVAGAVHLAIVDAPLQHAHPSGGVAAPVHALVSHNLEGDRPPPCTQDAAHFQLRVLHVPRQVPEQGSWVDLGVKVARGQVKAVPANQALGVVQDVVVATGVVRLGATVGDGTCGGLLTGQGQC